MLTSDCTGMLIPDCMDMVIPYCGERGITPGLRRESSRARMSLEDQK
jgi:hypothetical protein